MTETNAESLVEIEALLNEQREFPPPEAFRVLAEEPAGPRAGTWP